MAKPKARPAKSPVRALDPLNVNERIYRQLALVLDELEKKKSPITFSQRLTAIVYIGRMQTMFMGLRKEHRDEPTAGSAVRKYADAFKAHDARGRTKDTGPAVDNWDAPDVGDDDADDAA